MLNRPIILCGYTSCGKTTIGHLLSQMLEIDFYDTDQILTSQHQKSISDIFSQGGEALFRQLEYGIVKQVCSLGPSVVSTGGGMLASEQNARLLSRHGIIIYIQRPFEACYQSLSQQPERPLFKNHTKEELAATYEKRSGIYQKYSSFTVKNEHSPQAAANSIYDFLLLKMPCPWPETPPHK